MTNLKPRIAHKEEVGKLLKPIVVGGDILAYSYVRELNRAFGIEQTIVLAAAEKHGFKVKEKQYKDNWCAFALI